MGDSYDALQFRKSRHARYFKLHLDMLPEKSSSYDSIRVTLLFFAISGLDVLSSVESVLDTNRQKDIIDWIYRLQVVPDHSKSNIEACGFQGSNCLNFKKDETSCGDNMSSYRLSNLALTYSALCTLLILGDDLSWVNKKALLCGVKSLQEKSGSFKCTLADGDSDMRFVFCAASICFILDDWSGMDSDLCLQYVFNSLCYDGGFAQGPNLESHGGSTYCALATLALMGRLDMLNSTQVERLKRWLIFRQVSSFQGRPNKPVDTCYTFWIGASLSILNSLGWVDEQQLIESVMDTQHHSGGFSKWPDTQADILHTYLGIAGLSLLKTQSFELSPVYPALNITSRAFAHLKQLHKNWSQEY